MDDYIYFSIDGRNLKINKENPDDILMLKTQWGNRKMKNPRWFQPKIQTLPKGYKYIHIGPKNYLLHRLNYYAHNQDWNIYNSCIKTNSIDHRDIKKTNNNIENLYIVTNQENQWNTKAKGCDYCKREKKWRARITLNGKEKHLGYFIIEAEARNAYLEAKKIYHIIE